MTLETTNFIKFLCSTELIDHRWMKEARNYILNIHPEKVFPLLNDIQAIAKLALCCLLNDDLKKAKKYFEIAIRKQNISWWLYNQYLKTLCKIDLFDKAEVLAEKQYKNCSNAQNAFSTIALSLSMQAPDNNTLKIKKLYQKDYNLKRQSSGVKVNFAVFLAGLGKVKASLKLLNEALKENPDLENIYLRAAIELIHKHEFDKARAFMIEEVKQVNCSLSTLEKVFLLTKKYYKFHFVDKIISSSLKRDFDKESLIKFFLNHLSLKCSKKMLLTLAEHNTKNYDIPSDLKISFLNCIVERQLFKEAENLAINIYQNMPDRMNLLSNLAVKYRELIPKGKFFAFLKKDFLLNRQIITMNIYYSRILGSEQKWSEMNKVITDVYQKDSGRLNLFSTIADQNSEILTKKQQYNLYQKDYKAGRISKENLVVFFRLAVSNGFLKKAESLISEIYQCLPDAKNLYSYLAENSNFKIKSAEYIKLLKKDLEAKRLEGTYFVHYVLKLISSNKLEEAVKVTDKAYKDQSIKFQHFEQLIESISKKSNQAYKFIQNKKSFLYKVLLQVSGTELSNEKLRIFTNKADRKNFLKIEIWSKIKKLPTCEWGEITLCRDLEPDSVFCQFMSRLQSHTKRSTYIIPKDFIPEKENSHEFYKFCAYLYFLIRSCKTAQLKPILRKLNENLHPDSKFNDIGFHLDEKSIHNIPLKILLTFAIKNDDKNNSKNYTPFNHLCGFELLSYIQKLLRGIESILNNFSHIQIDDIIGAANSFYSISQKIKGRTISYYGDYIAQFSAVTEIIRKDSMKTFSFLEIGTLYGGSTLQMLMACRKCQITGNATCIDPLDGYYGESDPFSKIRAIPETLLENFRRMNFSPSDLKIIRKLSTSTDALATLKKASFDLLLIDGDHSGKGVKFDWDNYNCFVRKGGFVLFDDYVNTLYPELTKAVDRICLENKDSWKIKTLCGSTLILEKL